MKIKTISRSSADYVRERVTDIQKVQRNFDPLLHPQEKAREYTRALRAAKLERMFAKPFICALDGHVDGIYSIAKNPLKLDHVLSGSGDGELRLWSLSNQKTLARAENAHDGMVAGITYVPSTQNKFISVGADKFVKVWDFSLYSDFNTGKNVFSAMEPVTHYTGKEAFNGIDHHRNRDLFATCSSVVSIWDVNRSEPISNLVWGADTIRTVKLNQSEVNVLASSGTDRNIILYDLRTSSPISKLVMSMSSNAISWNPTEPFVFAAASEDHNCYTFDMRKMDHATNVMKDHVSAVMDVDYSPTGLELVTASYDRTIRLFDAKRGHSRDVYHTKRMQRVFVAKYTMDNKFVVSGSDDGNLRVWRSEASQRVGAKSSRQVASLNYMSTVKDKFTHMPEVRRVLKQRNLPKDISKAKRTKTAMLEARKTKEENKRKHSKPGSVPHVSERVKPVVGVTFK
ncbi:hypothetical protein BB560_003765 [Smittium megazygosporum]|uniref:Sof1-like protein domain-containing protein n=1 Tax=Smittium megazygosporum TaxID=133381 RepID=A0A2T9ZB52_9FUNG|nr:hypothetical protein BB560_003765 [Smittium megazygosporum]